MTFWQSVQGCFRQYADPRGRASRSEYWWFNAFVVLVWVAVVLHLAWGLAEIGHESLGMLLAFLVWLSLIPPFWSVHVRRCHDLGRSGWTLFPFVHFHEGDPFPNKYGPAPDRWRAPEEATVSWWEIPSAVSAPPATFVPCGACERTVNREIERCPYCRERIDP